MWRVELGLQNATKAARESLPLARATSSRRGPRTRSRDGAGWGHGGDDVEADPVERQERVRRAGSVGDVAQKLWLTAFVSLSIRKTRAACALQTSLDQKEVVAVLGRRAPWRRAVLGRRRSSGHASAPASSRSTSRRAGRSRRREAGRRTRANNRRSPLAPTSTTNPDRPRTPFGQRSARVSSGCRVPRCPCSRRHGTLPRGTRARTTATWEVIRRDEAEADSSAPVETSTTRAAGAKNPVAAS